MCVTYNAEYVYVGEFTVLEIIFTHVYRSRKSMSAGNL